MPSYPSHNSELRLANEDADVMKPGQTLAACGVSDGATVYVSTRTHSDESTSDDQQTQRQSQTEMLQPWEMEDDHTSDAQSMAMQPVDIEAATASVCSVYVVGSSGSGEDDPVQIELPGGMDTRVLELKKLISASMSSSYWFERRRILGNQIGLELRLANDEDTDVMKPGQTLAACGVSDGATVYVSVQADTTSTNDV
jgi:hypothetical protein